MSKYRMIVDLEIALEDNTNNLLMERRSIRQVELLAARTEILKSIIHLQREILADLALAITDTKTAA